MFDIRDKRGNRLLCLTYFMSYINDKPPNTVKFSDVASTPIAGPKGEKGDIGP